jgi:hypothetical protein
VEENIMKFIRYLVSGWLVLAAIHSHAAVVLVSDIGSSFDLQYDDASLGLYGNPTLVNNVVSFTPTSFVAGVAGQNQFFIRSSTISFQLVAKSDQDFSNFSLLERGAFFLEGANSRVNAQGQIKVFSAANPVASEVTSNITSSATNGSAPGTLLTALPSSYNDGLIYNWAGVANLAATPELVSAQIVNVTIENFLSASTGAQLAIEGFPPEAFIEKKYTGPLVSFSILPFNVSPIPEPSEWMMLLCGLFAIGLIARRRVDQAL